MWGKFFLNVVLFVLVSSFCCAFSVSDYNISFDIINNRVVVDSVVVFDGKVSGFFALDLPFDYAGLSVYVDDKSVESGDDVFLKNNSKVRYNYVTGDFIDKSNFLMSFMLDFDVDDFVVKLTLPEGAMLKKQLSSGDMSSGSIFPKPSVATTDGKSLIFYWKDENVKVGDEFSFFVQIEQRRNLWWLTFVVVVVGVFLFLIFRKKHRPKIVVGKPLTKVVVHKHDMVEKHLKEDEEIIVNVLRLKEGSCEQGTLMVATGFSKATLSRLLKELEDRKVVIKEKRGKKNLVFLKD